MPRLRVQPRGAGLVRNLHLGTEAHQVVDGTLIGRTDVGRGDDAQASATGDQIANAVFDEPYALHLDECTQQVDRFG
jgi:hypothetical protein